MNDLFLIACGAGLQDGLNPCIFMTCAVFIAYGLCLKKMLFRVSWLCVVFVSVYALGSLFFNFLPTQFFVLQKDFVIAAKVLYFVLGAGAFILGILFLRDWFLHRAMLGEDLADKEIKFFSSIGLAVCLTTVILGVVLSAMATIWPVDKYILVLGNAAIIKGQWQTVAPLLVAYVFISMWPLWFVWAFLSIKNLRPSLLTIACASIFLTASSCVILMFK